MEPHTLYLNKNKCFFIRITIIQIEFKSFNEKKEVLLACHQIFQGWGIRTDMNFLFFKYIIFFCELKEKKNSSFLRIEVTKLSRVSLIIVSFIYPKKTLKCLNFK